MMLCSLIEVFLVNRSDMSFILTNHIPWSWRVHFSVMWEEKELLKLVIKLFSHYEPFLLWSIENTGQYSRVPEVNPALISWAMSAYNPVSHSKNWGMVMTPCKHKGLCLCVLLLLILCLTTVSNSIKNFIRNKSCLICRSKASIASVCANKLPQTPVEVKWQHHPLLVEGRFWPQYFTTCITKIPKQTRDCCCYLKYLS